MLNLLQSSDDGIKNRFMRTLIIIFLVQVLSAPQLYSRDQDIRLPELIDAAMSNRGEIRAARIDALIASLRTSEISSDYMPLISFAYDIRYNILTPSQIVPVGQFFTVPTDETRAIRFGTDWQQNAGVTFYQPIIDLSLRSRINESRISERIISSDAVAAENELKSEVIRSFALVWLREEQLKSATLDTVRTFTTKELVSAKVGEGQDLKTELNRAAVNHNNSVALYRALLSDYFNEKIYLGFLTGLPVQTLLEKAFDFDAFSGRGNFYPGTAPAYDSIPEIIKLELRAQLADQQKRTLRNTIVPVLGFEGFIGANQYTENFDPFLGRRWYGASFFGLNLRMTLLSGDNTKHKTDQLKLQAEGLKYQMEDQKSLINNKLLRLDGEIKQIAERIALMNQNITLLEENILIYQERFAKGQISAYDMVTFETDLQKEISGMNEQITELVNKQIEVIKISGRLDTFIENLRQ